MKRVGNIVVRKKVGVQKNSANEVPKRGQDAAGGVTNLKKDKNVVGVEPVRGGK